MKPINSLGYQISFETPKFSALNRFLKKQNYANHVVLCDENTMQHCLPQLIMACPNLQAAEIIELEPGEQTKSIEIATQIWDSLMEQKASRYTLLINLGGGVIGDLGGFCASVYKRGIDFVNIPTTLLAMADASVGGKTGIDFSGIKNSIGSFAQPAGVFIHRPFLNTLPSRQLMNGLAEIYKMALIAEAKLWNSLSEITLLEMIERSVALKNAIVLKDPTEKGGRKVLNFGHTIGHAIEGFVLKNGGDILHGEAIVAGMIIETHLSWQKKLVSTNYRNDVIITLQLIFELIEFPFTSADLLPYMQQDKKNTTAGISFSLLSGPGKCKHSQTCTSTQIEKAINYYQALVND